MDKSNKEVKQALPAPTGIEKFVNTPWGTNEKAFVVKNRAFGTREETYAMIENPRPYVRFSAFRVV
jgi:hypothetical protein